jgi:RNA polymerase sigma-70 factor (ECF subfamily)
MTDAERAAIHDTRAGNPDAFGVLVRLHSRALYRLAVRIVGRPEKAEDVVQEAFLRAFRALDRFDDRGEILPWLRRIAANAAIDELRRARREEPLAGEDDREWEEGHLFRMPASPEPSPDRRTASAQVGRAARRALAGLSPDERTAFLLRHVEGCSIAEISRALGKRENATKQSIFRAVRKLRRSLVAWTEVRREELA